MLALIIVIRMSRKLRKANIDEAGRGATISDVKTTKWQITGARRAALGHRPAKRRRRRRLML